ncbi:Protein halfway [Orchesella cincta]|uniref:Protein halfway n=1 Tax=Orchesella cincta TaxID=48709 RepID=A0A1D2ML89_ORCCI|nr:Protein halfway [Orchesella cincta]
MKSNPLDCTNLAWIESPNLKLLHPNQTLCDQPPHQNKAKPIFKVLRLLKKVRDECRVNCSCDIAYIWEQNHIIHSKTVVNCSGRGFWDFPNPEHLPKPTDTLDLRRNKITSMSTFVADERYYEELHMMNLYLDDNKISSIDILETSDWFYHFQQFSIQRNDLTEVPVYVLENVFRQNKRLLQIDLSSNKFKCDCFTVSSFKVWLLKYTNQIGNIEQVRCHTTKEQIRYMRMEEWCKVDNGAELLNVLDMVSIVLAILIIVVIAKVYYDYWNFKTKGKLPWIVSKM